MPTTALRAPVLALAFASATLAPALALTLAAAQVSVSNTTAHPKFTDYTFDVDTFTSRLNAAIDSLRRRRSEGEDIVEVY